MQIMPGKTFLLLALLILFASACSAQPVQPTRTAEPVSTPSPARLPLMEAEVSRVTVTEAKAAFDSGAALFVDVRSAEAFEASHISSSINIPLGEIESDPAGLDLAKDQWIITYCT